MKSKVQADRSLSTAEEDVLRVLARAGGGMTLLAITGRTNHRRVVLDHALTRLHDLGCVHIIRGAQEACAKYRITPAGRAFHSGAEVDLKPDRYDRASIAGHPLPWSIVPHVNPPVKRPGPDEDDHDEEAAAAFIVDADGYKIRRFYVDGEEGKLWTAVVEHQQSVSRSDDVLWSDTATYLKARAPALGGRRDIVERLRQPWFTHGCEAWQLEAATEIERLRSVITAHAERVAT